MAAISFKSIGDLSRASERNQDAQPQPVGIITPVIYSRRIGGPFEMSNVPLDQIVDNFKNMLLTNHGERVPLYDYGANLRSLLTERLSKEDYNERAMQQIRSSTEKYMPYINLNSFEMTVLSTDQNGLSKIKIKVDFSIPRLTTSLKTVEIIMTNIG